MVIYKKIFLSVNQPEIDNGIWLKPVGDNIEMYLIDGGQAKAVKGEGGTNIDTTTLKNEIIGTDKDSSLDLTLIGLNKRITDLKGWVEQQLESFKEHPENHTNNH